MQLECTYMYAPVTVLLITSLPHNFTKSILKCSIYVHEEYHDIITPHILFPDELVSSVPVSSEPVSLFITAL